MTFDIRPLTLDSKNMKVLIATDKPFAKIAVDGIRQEGEAAEIGRASCRERV